MRRTKLKKEWYWFGDLQGFEGIKVKPEGGFPFCPESGCEGHWGSHGPFSSFAEAKKDALDHFKCDLDLARRAIQDVKSVKRHKV